MTADLTLHNPSSLAFVQRDVGRTLVQPRLRIYLSGRMTVESGDHRVGPEGFPGQQGRTAFAFLVSQMGQPVPRGELAEAIWPDARPDSWTTALSAIVSKLRSVLGEIGLDGKAVLVPAAGCYELRLPSSTWVDHDVASDNIHEAEAALKSGDPRSAYGPSAVAHHIARRPFLPGEDAPWIVAKREKLRSILIRALECRASVYLWNEEHALAVEAARDVVHLRPFRESGYRLLMKAHAAGGNSAEALWVYERCRTLLAEELGVGPSEQTRVVHAEVLGA